MKKRFTLPVSFTNYLVVCLLALVPFHAFITVWLASLVGHYTLLRLWNVAVLLLVVGVVLAWLARDAKLRAWFTGSLLVRAIAVYVLLTVSLGIAAYAKGAVTVTALGYGLLVNLRFLVWFLAVLLVAQRSQLLGLQWKRVLCIPAAFVVTFAVLQYTVLPHNFLTHFGYNADTTIAPIETINHNAKYIRVQSTLRGANPLGAYLLVVLSAAAMLVRKSKNGLLWAVASVVTVFALYATGSRSAWIGAAITLLCIAYLRLRTRQQRLLLAGLVVVCVGLAGLVYTLVHDNPAIQNAVLHTQDGSAVADTSNEAHLAATRAGLKDVWEQPWGAGPGTAGPASQHNGVYPARIAENYYVQIAQEVGLVGLLVLLVIFVLVALELYMARSSQLALALLASFIGLSFVGLLLHVWADDTLAFVWWGLAGIALGSRPYAKQKKAHA